MQDILERTQEDDSKRFLIENQERECFPQEVKVGSSTGQQIEVVKPVKMDTGRKRKFLDNLKSLGVFEYFCHLYILRFFIYFFSLYFMHHRGQIF